MSEVENLLTRIAKALERAATTAEQSLELRQTESTVWQNACDAQTKLHGRMLPSFPAPSPNLGVVEPIDGGKTE